MPSSLLDAALSYAEQGWPVFPCKDQGKTPRTPRGFHDATTDAAMVRSWWTRWPEANIGIPTGAVSGFVVIDIDTGDDKQGDASYAELTAEHGTPATIEAKTGTGGRHLLFKCPDPPIKNTASALAKHIDTRGDGGYIIAAPSVHPSGGRYEWVHGPEHRQLADLPEWLTPVKKKPKQATPAKTQYSGDAYRRASAYLAKMPPSVSGSGGHSAAFAAAVALVHGFRLPPHIARSLFATEFNPRCEPVWSDKEIDHKIKQAETTQHDNPAGWLLDADNDAEAKAHGEAVAARLLQPKDPPPQEESAPEGFPPHLLQPPGLLGEICHWINETAFKPQPILTLANSLAFLGALYGQRVKTARNLRTNLYCLGVAASGAGKDHSRRQIKSLCTEVGLTAKLLGGEDVSSDSAILTALNRNPACLFQFDEIGHFFATATAKNAATYQRAIPVTLTKLYSSSGTTYLGKEYADERAERRDIEQPCACVYGTSVPSRLYEGITPAEIRDGFLGRMLIFQSHDADPDPVDRAPVPPPRPILEMVEAWFNRKTTPEGVGNIAAVSRPHPMVVEDQADAVEVFMAFREKCRHAKRELAQRHEDLDALWGRAEENARKIALIVACGCEFGGPVVSGEVAAWSCDLVGRLVDDLVRAVRLSVSESDYGRKRLQIMSAIQGAGSEGTSKSSLARRFRGIRKRERDEMIEDMVLAGDVEIVQVETSGRPATMYRGTT